MLVQTCDFHFLTTRRLCLEGERFIQPVLGIASWQRQNISSLPSSSHWLGLLLPDLHEAAVSTVRTSKHCTWLCATGLVSLSLNVSQFSACSSHLQLS